MGFDTKPNFSSNKFEQCVGDVMNLSGCTQIYGVFDMETGSTLTVFEGSTLKVDEGVFNITTGSGIDKILRSDADGNATWINIPITDAVNGLTVTDGTVLLGGSLIQETEIDLNSNQFTITNQNPPFTIGTGFDEVVTAVVEDADGKYLVAGRFHDYSGVTANGLIRLNSDGTVDDTLDTGAGFTKPDTTTGISPMAIDANGKILVAGSFTQYDGASHPYIVRLCTDGTYDSSFTPPTSSSVINGGRVIYIKDNGKILVGGDFDKHLIQLCSDGTVDTSFNVGTGFAGGQTGPNPYTFVLDIAEQSDGKLIIGGDYTSYNGNNAGHLIRLCSDGSYDDTFDTYPGFNRRVKNISIESDGKILLVGEFTGYTATTAHNSSGIAKLNSDGTYDTSYDVGDGFTGSTGTETYHIGGHKILKQINNQTLITGYFTWYDGSDVSGIVRLNTDATIDTDFDSGTGFDSIPADSIVTSTGKFLLGGNFTEYDGTSFNRIVRLSYYGELDNQAVDSMVVFNGKVVEYGDDYSSYYTNRSLVDKEYVDNKVATGTTGNEYDGLTPAAIEVGGIGVGTVLTGKTYTELFEELLVPELCGTVTNPSVAGSLGSTGLFEIGCSLSQTIIGTFNSGCINPQYDSLCDKRTAGPNAYCFVGTGTSTGFQTCVSCTAQDTTASFPVPIGTTSWSVCTKYDAGFPALSNKGNEFCAALGSGCTSSSNVSIYGVYPLWATCSAIGSLTQITQLYNMPSPGTVQLELVTESGGDKQKFELPCAWISAPTNNPLTGVRTWVGVAGAWCYLNGGTASCSLTEWDTSAATETVQGNIIGYCQYEFNGIDRSVTCIRLEF